MYLVFRIDQHFHNFFLTSLYIDSDAFISSSDYKSGAWPSGNLRFEQ